MKIRHLLMAWAAAAAAIVIPLGGAAAGAAGASAQGVTSTTIRIGIPYIDFAALKSIGVNLDQGSAQDAYSALIANLNKHGGINGRRLVPYFVAVSPIGTAPALTACTQLDKDDSIFVSINPEQSDCYLQQGVPVINGLSETTLPPGSAANFTLITPPNAFDQLQLPIFAKRGLFKGKTVGLFAGSSQDDSELAVVQSTLKKLNVHVVVSAVDSAPPGDTVAANQDVAVIAQRFQQSGVNEVVAVGGGSTLWPQGLLANQSTYNPPWFATNGEDLQGYIASATGNSSTYLKTVVSASSIPSNYAVWQDPKVKECVSTIHKAYPSDEMTAPTQQITSNNNDLTYDAPEHACEYLALFAAIAKAAGRHLTVASFTHAGEGLRNVAIPGVPSVSFGAGRSYAVGLVYLITYNPNTRQVVYANKPLHQ